MREKRTTLKDVAKEAKVSVMSVSKALNNKEGVSPETRQYILDIAQRLNYYPNMVAKNLRLDKTNTLGVVVSDCSEMVTAKVLRGIADGAAEEDYNIITINTDGDSTREHMAIELFLNKCVDGILMVAPTLSHSKDMEWMNTLNIPMAVLMRDSAHLSVDSVLNNNLRGGFEIAESLIKRGCRSFKFLSLTSVSQIGISRLEGARLAFEKHGLVFDSDRIRYCRPYIPQAETAMQAWIDEAGVDFDALICACDVIAIGAINVLLRHGVRVPEDVAVSGYDDIELAEYLRVPLTTMRQPFYEIGRKGVGILLERIKTPMLPTQHILLDSALVERESSGR